MLSILLHLTLGWQASIVGAIVSGFWSIKRGWLSGMATLTLTWGILLGWSFLAARYESFEWAKILGSLLGNIPPLLSIAISILVAAILGGLAGILGESVATILSSKKSR